MARDLAIDLGTANTLVYMKGRGIVLNEPSVIALNRQTGEVLATGREAWQMIGRTPGYIVAVRPLRGGAITDFEITERMIRLLLQRVGVSRFTRPKVVICVPSAITEVERRAVTDAARRAGAADANLIEQPMAAAIGADLPIDEPVGNMVIDIGGGTSETAVISLGGIVALEAVRVGSFDIDASIQNYVRREHGIAIGERTAEEIKVAIGSADPIGEENQAEVRGRDLMSGLPKTVLLTPEEIRFAIEDVISSIIASVKTSAAGAPARRHRLDDLPVAGQRRTWTGFPQRTDALWMWSLPRRGSGTVTFGRPAETPGPAWTNPAARGNPRTHPTGVSLAPHLLHHRADQRSCGGHLAVPDLGRDVGVRLDGAVDRVPESALVGDDCDAACGDDLVGVCASPASAPSKTCRAAVRHRALVDEGLDPRDVRRRDRPGAAPHPVRSRGGPRRATTCGPPAVRRRRRWSARPAAALRRRRCRASGAGEAPVGLQPGTALSRRLGQRTAQLLDPLARRRHGDEVGLGEVAVVLCVGLLSARRGSARCPRASAASPAG